MAKALMIQGTGSGVGKSIITAGLCRIFSNRGIRVAPFKGQNMALNSFITKAGGEIGRAQAFQAEAARIEPTTDMNPVLLKATGEAGCQVILNGAVHANMSAREYYAFKDHAWPAVTEAYDRLEKKHDLIIIEGAGSPAEINLAKDEVVNMSVARYAKAPVLLVGDIDKGGVFASLFGTLALLDNDADLIKAFVINKFRGDLAILQPGLDMIRERTQRPVLGVLPYLGDLGLHEEDGIPLERLWQRGRVTTAGKRLKIVVLPLRYISNFTDCDPFLYEPDVDLVFSLRDADIEHADLIVIPGSKNTVQDLLYLREAGIEESIKRAAQAGSAIIGVCGGYQMLGRRILDPYGIESKRRETAGMGLLDIETVMEKTKVTSQVTAFRSSSPGEPLRGYEIHMGKTFGDVGLFRMERCTPQGEPHELPGEAVRDGSQKGAIWGTAIHGIFDNDGFRRHMLNDLRKQRGWGPIDEIHSFSAAREQALGEWASILERNIDMQAVMKISGLQ